MSTGDWHLAVGGTVLGPFSIDRLRDEIVAGNLDRDSLVWSDGMADWSKAGDVPALFSAIPPPLPFSAFQSLSPPIPAIAEVKTPAAPEQQHSAPRRRAILRWPTSTEEALSSVNRGVASGYVLSGLYLLGAALIFGTGRSLGSQQLSPDEVVGAVGGGILCAAAVAALTYLFRKKHYVSIVMALGLLFAFEVASKWMQGRINLGWLVVDLVVAAGFLSALQGALYLRRERLATRKAEKAAEAVTGGVRVDTESTSPKRGIIGKHWRGELSLPVSYWVIGVLLSVPFFVVMTASGSVIGEMDLSPGFSATWFLSFIALLVVLTVWQTIGIWRSAGSYIRTRPRPVWAYAARVAIVLGVLQAIMHFGTLSPLLQRSVELVLGHDNIPSYHVRLLRNGTEVELSGGMSTGTAIALQSIIDAAPAIQVVHLNSTGGFLGEGFRINKLLSERKLATYTSAECVSACTIAFLGGSERFIAPQGKLGFHSAHFGVDGKVLPELNDEMVATLRSYGAPQWFIKKAFSTPSTSMWYPTHDELLQAHIVHQVVDADQFALSGFGASWKDPSAVEANIRQAAYKIHWMQAIKLHEPQTYENMLALMTKGVIEGRSMGELQQEVFNTVATHMLPKYLKYGRGEELLAYWRVQHEEMAHLAASNPEACVAFLFPERRAANWNPMRLFTPELIEKDTNAMAELLNAGIDPSSDVDVSLSQEDLEMVMKATDLDIPDAQSVIENPMLYVDQGDLLCRTFTALFTHVLSLPKDRAIRFLRYMGTP